MLGVSTFIKRFLAIHPPFPLGSSYRFFRYRGSREGKSFIFVPLRVRKNEVKVKPSPPPPNGAILSKFSPDAAAAVAVSLFRPSPKGRKEGRGGEGSQKEEEGLCHLTTFLISRLGGGGRQKFDEQKFFTVYHTHACQKRI